MTRLTDLPLTFVQREPLAQGAAPWLLVLMHGVGSNEQDFFGLAAYVPAHFHVLSLRAPYPMGPNAHGWFQFTVDAYGLRHIDAAQERAGRELLARALAQAQQQLGIGSERTVLAGFSQGGIMALSLLLTQPQRMRAAMVWHSRLLPGMACGLKLLAARMIQWLLERPCLRCVINSAVAY